MLILTNNFKFPDFDINELFIQILPSIYKLVEID